MKKKRLALEQAGDEPAMLEAVASLRNKTKLLVRPTEFQLKFGPVNFYPRTGAIHIDDHGPLTQKGLPIVETIAAHPHRTVEDVIKTCRAEGWVVEVNVVRLFETGPIR